MITFISTSWYCVIVCTKLWITFVDHVMMQISIDCINALKICCDKIYVQFTRDSQQLNYYSIMYLFAIEMVKYVQNVHICPLPVSVVF